jgi:glycosyltransferase involved in cell wall biosynthesis
MSRRIMPTVSVILPLYNGRRFVGEAIASVVEQTQPPDELIVVDDGSDDGVADELERHEADFSIKIVRQENAGQSAARNHGARLASGSLLAFIDQDDVWHPQHLEVLCHELARARSAGWAYSDFDEVDERGNTVTKGFLAESHVEHPKRSLMACLASDLMVLPSASVIRRDAYEELGGFDESLSGYEDDDLFIRMFRSHWEFVFVRRSLTRFRLHQSSSSANPRFLRSRMRFAAKLRMEIADDLRSERYYFRDLVVPRLFQVSLNDYARAASQRDWDIAFEALRLVNHFGAMRRDYGAIRWKLAMIQNPRVFRTLLQAQEFVPPSFRPTNNPVVHLR